MEGTKEGMKGVLGIDAEIFEITPVFHLVELKKSNGDTMEYQNTMKQDIRCLEITEISNKSDL